jgi:hypothetical protein
MLRWMEPMLREASPRMNAAPFLWWFGFGGLVVG